jgi:hypothetical protein
MFDRICRENGVTHHLTPPRTPTTTGKIERYHQSLQNDWLTDCPGFDSIAEAQTALDAFVVVYNTDRPHQSLDMDFPADRFRPRLIDELGLRLPPALGGQRPAPVVPAIPVLPSPRPAPQPVTAPQLVMSANGVDPVNLAVQIDRVVPTCGNLTVCGHQFWLTPILGGAAIQLWIDTTVVHILREQTRIKSVPSRFSTAQLRQLLADGATIAGPPPTPGGKATGGFEVDRLVNRCGVIGLAGRAHPIGYHLAGQRVIVRIDGPVMQILDLNRTLLRTLSNPLRADDRRHVRDGRPAGPPPVVPETPAAIERRVSCRGVIMVAGQRITVGIGHAGLTVTVTSVGDSFQIYDEDKLLTEVPRRTTKPIARFKARKPELPRPRVQP